ncbi:MAG: 3-hydroxybutyrate dehydrogenase [Pseudomonadota bacterium]
MNEKKNILVTGAASGIGYGIAEYLAQQGHNIIISDIQADAAEKAAEAICAQQLSACAIALDVTDKAAIATLSERPECESVDVVVNNAGLQHVSKIEDFPAEKWQLLIDVMLVGPALMTQTFLAGMRKRNYGRIINVGSLHSLVASPYKSAYIAAKHGLLGFAKTIALETGDTDITINTLCPAYVKTPLVENQIAAQAKANNMSEEDVINKIMLEPMPKKAFITIEELAQTAAFLMSPAARNITGQTMVLDGGWVAR